MISKPVTILNTGTTSSAIDTGDRNGNVKLVGLTFPTLVGATTFSLKMSLDGTTFYQILDTAGAAIAIPVAETGTCYVPIDSSYTTGIRYFQIIMGGAVSADRIITPVVQREMYP